jgi:hypothetical protein
MQRAGRIAQAPLLLLWPFWVLPAQVSATAPVSVFVADATSGAPLVEARVEFPALALSRNTDQFGTAYFPTVKSGVLRIKVAKIGYRPIEQDVTLEMPTANPIELSVAMRSLEVAQALDTVKVIGKTTYFDLLSGFERRRRLGLGKYFTAAQLDSSAHVPLADLITRRVTGVRAEWGYSRIGVRLMSLRGPISISQPQCFVQVYVDNNKADGQDLAHIQSGDVAGIEYYSIAPPVQYSSNAACGVLLVWTKR